ncbi:MAG: hypothetical protein J6V08_05185 [Candidatus Methanomethylophilaceae archaeon]|nr:hypothetical protein [Candidatus Methanomethylophilaceae archaeon]MBO5669512.1 hypothetical protein [Candidatus Methanomethylophilaceae archaeon]MBO7205793.1 hypothetical protein [Candidatus Methanomethylophilaceae archaeon]
MDIKEPKNLVIALAIVFTILFAGLCFVNIFAAAIAFIIDAMIVLFGVFVYNSDIKSSV